MGYNEPKRPRGLSPSVLLGRVLRWRGVALVGVTCLTVFVALSVLTRANVLTLEHRAVFKRDGFVVVRNFFSEAEAARMKQYASEVEFMPEVLGGVWKYFETAKEHVDEEGRLVPGGEVISRIENFANKHPGWDATLQGARSRIQAAVEELFGEEALLWKEKINFKKAGSAGFVPHQDAQAGWAAYGHSVHINAGVALDAATIQNGCLEIVAGENRNGLLGPEFGQMDPAIVKKFTWVPYPMSTRDLLLFDSYVPHRSFPNQTPNQRRVVLATYNRKSEGDGRAAYHNDKLSSHPPRVAKIPGKKYRGYTI